LQAPLGHKSACDEFLRQSEIFSKNSFRTFLAPVKTGGHGRRQLSIFFELPERFFQITDLPLQLFFLPQKFFPLTKTAKINKIKVKH
jgi:hypothetical protein